jgi:excisionase family DNA binding protein
VPKLISLAEAARISGLSPSHLRKLVSEGSVPGEKIGRDWLTTAEAVQEYLKRGNKPGPKRKADRTIKNVDNYKR